MVNITNPSDTMRSHSQKSLGSAMIVKELSKVQHKQIRKSSLKKYSNSRSRGRVETSIEKDLVVSHL